MENYFKKAQEASGYIQNNLKTKPEIAVILGSGLGPLVDEISNPEVINYADVPNFPRTTVKGHEGKFVAGQLGGKHVLAMKGRFHYYEGYAAADVVFPVRVMRLLGIGNLLVTNAAGGVNRNFKPGDLMLIKDHISFYAPSPLRGSNLDEFGPRFPDLSEAYSRRLIDAAEKTALKEGIKVQLGVYAFTQGPMYETPAEVRALGMLGADAVGMSTVPEVIAARHAGMDVLGISCITNMAAGILNQSLSHEEVMKTAREVENRFALLVRKIIENWEILK